jgi:hypothetical protein
MANLKSSWLYATASVRALLQTALGRSRSDEAAFFLNEMPVAGFFHQSKTAVFDDGYKPVNDGQDFVEGLGRIVLDPDTKPWLRTRTSCGDRKQTDRQKTVTIADYVCQGPVPAYCRMVQRSARGLAPMLVLNALANDRPENRAPDAAGQDKANTGLHLAQLAGPGGLIVLVSAAPRALQDPTLNRQWETYLGRAATLEGTITLPGLIRDTKQAGIYRKLLTQVYPSFTTWNQRKHTKVRQRIRSTYLPAHKVRVLRAQLRRLRLAHAQHPFGTTEGQTPWTKLWQQAVWDSSVKEARRYHSVYSAGRDDDASDEGFDVRQTTLTESLGIETGPIESAPIGSHDRTGQAAQRSRVSLTERATAIAANFEAHLGGYHRDVMIEAVTDGLCPKAEKIKLPEALRETYPADFAEWQKIESLADFVSWENVVVRAADEALAAASAAPDVLPLAVISQIEALGEEHEELLNSIQRSLRKTTFNHADFKAARDALYRRAHRRLDFCDIALSFWRVTDELVSTAMDSGKPTTVRSRLFFGTGKAEAADEAEPTPTALMAKLIEDAPATPPAIRIGHMDEFGAEPCRSLLGPIIERQRKLHVLRRSPGEIPNLGLVPKAPWSACNPSAVEITQRLQPKFHGAAEDYLMFDRALQIYNPALGRESSLRRALLERPTLIAQGTEFVQEQLGKFGYKCVIPIPVINLLGARRELSRRNQLPTRPILPFEAPAYYDYGPMTAQATLWRPDGTPVWIAGRSYIVKPGWLRQNRVVDENDLLESTPTGMIASTEQVILNAGITFYDIASEVGVVRVREDETREDLEMARSVRTYPDQAQQAITVAENTEALLEAGVRPAGSPNRTDGRGTVTPTTISVAAETLQTLTPEDAEVIAVLTQQLHMQERHVARTNRTPAGRAAATTEPAESVAPVWQPTLEDFIEVFPAPTPPDVSSIAQEQLQSTMTALLRRFGPRYAANTEGNSPVPFGPSPEVERQAFALWLAERGHAAAEAASRS